MADSIDNGGPAYPSKVSASPEIVKAVRELAGCGLHEAALALGNHPGMSLRDYLAGQALVGMGSWVPWVDDGNNRSVGDLNDPRVLQARARWAYAQADALVAERGGRGRW